MAWAEETRDGTGLYRARYRGPDGKACTVPGVRFTSKKAGDSPPQDIQHATGASMDGEMVGLETSVETVNMPDDMVPAELVGLGSVPDFFAFLDGAR